MKSFKYYLNESKKVYEFKIKIAGDFDSQCKKVLEAAFSKYDVNSISECRRAPIQECPYEFPDHKNINVSSVDVVLNYPATTVQLRTAISEALGIPLSCVKVRTLKEHEEDLLNHKYDKKPEGAKLLQDYADESISAQELVGETRMSGLLKELSAIKHSGTEYKLEALKEPDNKPMKISKKGPARSSVK